MNPSRRGAYRDQGLRRGRPAQAAFKSRSRPAADGHTNGRHGQVDRSDASCPVPREPTVLISPGGVSRDKPSRTASCLHSAKTSHHARGSGMLVFNDSARQRRRGLLLPPSSERPARVARTIGFVLLPARSRRTLRRPGDHASAGGPRRGARSHSRLASAHPQRWSRDRLATNPSARPECGIRRAKSAGAWFAAPAATRSAETRRLLPAGSSHERVPNRVRWGMDHRTREMGPREPNARRFPRHLRPLILRDRDARGLVKTSAEPANRRPQNLRAARPARLSGRPSALRRRPRPEPVAVNSSNRL